MRVHSVIGPLALLGLPLVPLVGCGGHHHNDDHECSSLVHADAAYAGSYVITYTPNDGSSDTGLTFNVTIGASGFMTGSGTDSSGTTTTLATAGDGTPSFAGDDTTCQNLAYVKIDYKRPNTPDVLEVRVSKKIDGTLVGTYSGTDFDGGTTLSKGTLTVAAEIAQ